MAKALAAFADLTRRGARQAERLKDRGQCADRDLLRLVGGVDPVDGDAALGREVADRLVQHRYPRNTAVERGASMPPATGRSRVANTSSPSGGVSAQGSRPKLVAMES